MRAMYQRRKGRDLFDLQQTLLHFPTLDTQSGRSSAASRAIKQERARVSRAESEQNMANKLQDALFQEHILPLLPADLHV